MTLHVLLVCGGGASSGFMAQNIRKAAKKRGIELIIEARSESEVESYLDKIHILLIGPHLKYMADDLKKITTPYQIQTEVIPQLIYGTLDGEKALDLILSLPVKEH